MYPSGNLFIPAPHGQLEAILKYPKSDPPRGVGLVLHPHPLHGGTMHNKVVYRTSAALVESGLITLRINFRGVGLSTGEHGYGAGEKEDVEAALGWIGRELRGFRVFLAGFSFGARVGLDAGIQDDRVCALIGVGAPVNKYDFSFLADCRKPILFVHGELDEFGDVALLRDIAARLPDEAMPGVEVIEGAGHFFDHHLDELKNRVRAWIEGIQARCTS